MIKLAMDETQSPPFAQLCHDALSTEAVWNNAEEAANDSGNFAMLCSHTFHECCIDEWAKSQDMTRHNIKLACPTCKRSTDDVHGPHGALLANSHAMATHAMAIGPSIAIEVGSEAEPQLAAGLQPATAPAATAP